jgi:hypothetical protein
MEDTMKNLMLMVFLTVFAVLFPAAPAMAQRGSGSRFEDFFGGQRGIGGGRGGAEAPTAGTGVDEEKSDEGRDLVSAEILRAFVEKSFTVTPEETTAVFVAEVEIFSRERIGTASGDYYRYTYHRDPESVVYVKVGRRENGGVVVVGRGKSSDIRRAAEKAANDAAKKLQRLFKKPEDRIIFLP